MLYHYWYRLFFFFSSRRRHTRWPRDWSSDVCSSDLEGYAWLSLLYDHRLGGVLADDMGLGKTLQTLALIVRARSLSPDPPPFRWLPPPPFFPSGPARAGGLPPGLALGCFAAPPPRAGRAGPR